MSYPLGGKFHVPHGVSNAILLSPVMHFNEPAIRERLALAYDRAIGAGATTSEEKSAALIARMQYTAVVKRQVSTDDGLTWGDSEIMFPEEGTFSRQPIQILSNGRWIYGSWLCTDGAAALADDPSAFQISDDGGESWRRVMVPGSAGRVHPTVVELEDGHLVAFMSGILANEKCKDVMTPGTHGTTFGGNPMGLVKLMQDAKTGEGLSNQYTFSLAASADEVTPKLIQGELDMACVPANLAAVLYQKTEGQIETLAVNTLGVLYIVENGNAVQSLSDLRGMWMLAATSRPPMR